jgi:hypothetical protein
VSGPARRPHRERSARPRRSEHAGIAIGLIEALGRLPEHRLLDRLIRGRLWIALVAFALIGIVTLQLGLLKLNAGIGHALQREASLQRDNAALSIENSELASGSLVESGASRLGMEMVPVGALRFLTSQPRSDAGHGAATLAKPAANAQTTAGESSSTSSSASSAAEGGEAKASESPASSASSASAASPPSSEGEESKAPPSESAGSRAGAEAPAAESTTMAAAPTPQAAGGGSTEPSGGTQAGTPGR